jgi:hypothetical protein
MIRGRAPLRERLNSCYVTDTRSGARAFGTRPIQTCSYLAFGRRMKQFESADFQAYNEVTAPQAREVTLVVRPSFGTYRRS